MTSLTRRRPRPIDRRICSCGATHNPSIDTYVGAFRYPETYGSVFTCRACESSYLLVQWEEFDESELELPSDVDVSGLLSDDEPHTSGLRDTRAA